VIVAALSASLLTACAEPTPSAQGVGRWTPIALEDGIGRAWAGGVWTGTEMIVWGGGGSGEITTPGPYCGYNRCGRGAAYSPATDSWRDLSTVGAPSARSQPSAVWTGTEMLIWGGRECTADGSCSDGGAYNPATDSWRPIDPQGVATPRSWHAAVWTGTEMMVFGGQDPEYRPLAALEAYDPGTDTWRSLPAEGAPSPRLFPRAFWTGEALLVWGGTVISDSEGVVRLTDGAAFDLGVGTWSPLPPSGLAANWYEGVWTGTEMILWSGAAGAAYSPTTASWRTISTRDAPPSDGPAVWTGTQMIVWGGTDTPGGAYDPLTDRWVTLTTRGEPALRRDHQVHWIGYGMLVFGGLNPFMEFTTVAAPPDCIFTF